MSLPACPVCSYPIFGFVRRCGKVVLVQHEAPSLDAFALDHLTGLIEFGTASRFHSRTRIDNGTDVDSNHVSSATLLTRLSEKTCAIRSQVYLSRYPQRVTAKYELRLRSGE